jgi:hypothetical protein
MITKLHAMNLAVGTELHYGTCQKHVGVRGGVKLNITRVRVSGQCKTWKTRPNEFRLPIKYGLYDSWAIDQYNGVNFHLPSDCPIK